MRGLNYKTRFIDLAGELNTEMPLFWVRKLSEALNGQGKAVQGASVLVLGVAYKRNIDDIRESPALDIIRLLEGPGRAGQLFRSSRSPLSRRWAGVPLGRADAGSGRRRRLRHDRHRPYGRWTIG